MKLADTVAIALKAIQSNALRSFLTTLGIIIGVASLIVMVAIGSGARQGVEERISNLGTNLLTLRPGSSRFGGRRGGAGTADRLTDADVEAIRDIPNVSAVSGSITDGVPVIFENTNWTSRVEGVNQEYPFIMDWPIEEGDFFSADDVRVGRRYAVIGQTVKRELFGSLPPLGERIRLRNVPFTVIGTLKSRGDSGGWRDQDDVIVAPLTAVRTRVAGNEVGGVPNAVEQIYIKVRSVRDIAQVTRDVTELMRTRRRLAPGQEDDFNIFDRADFIRARTETFRMMTWLLGASAAIVLVVGGISIMNIMLVSVTERTREIGLRLAVGARRQAILMQFLTEAVTLCVIGGLIGALIGVTMAYLVALYANWDVLIGPSLILMALATSAGVGIVFGYFPARRAARLNPIDALRYE